MSRRQGSIRCVGGDVGHTREAILESWPPVVLGRRRRRWVEKQAGRQVGMRSCEKGGPRHVLCVAQDLET